MINMYDTDSELFQNIWLNNTLINGNGTAIRTDCPAKTRLECVNIVNANHFEKNVASGSGGAIYSATFGMVKINNTMIDNKAGQGNDDVGSFPYSLGFVTRSKRILNSLKI